MGLGAWWEAEALTRTWVMPMWGLSSRSSVSWPPNHRPEGDRGGWTAAQRMPARAVCSRALTLGDLAERGDLRHGRGGQGEQVKAR